MKLSSVRLSVCPSHHFAAAHRCSGYARDARWYFNVCSKADISLIYRTETTTKKCKTEKKVKTDMQEVTVKVWGIM